MYHFTSRFKGTSRVYCLWENLPWKFVYLINFFKDLFKIRLRCYYVTVFQKSIAYIYKIKQCHFNEIQIKIQNLVSEDLSKPCLFIFEGRTKLILLNFYSKLTLEFWNILHFFYIDFMLRKLDVVFLTSENYKMKMHMID